MEIDTSLIGNVYYNKISGNHLETDTETSTLTNVVTEIINYNFDWRWTTLLVVNQFNIHMINIFLKQVLKPIVINYGKLEKKHTKNVTQYIIFGKGEEQIMTALEWIHTPEHISKIIIVCKDPMKCNEDVMFENAKKRNIFNVVFVKSENNGNVLVASYRYMTLISCARNNKLHKMNCSINAGQKNYTCLHSIFNDRRFPDLNKCPVSFAIRDAPPYANLNNLLDPLKPTGLIIYFLKFLANMANFQLVLKVTSRTCSEFLINNVTDILNSVQVDAIPCVMFKKNADNLMEASYPFGSFIVIWVNNFYKDHSEWMKLIYPLDYDLRVSILALFVSIILFLCFTKTKIWHKLFPGTIFRNRSLLLPTWAIFLGVPVTRIQSNTSFRIMIYTWMWFCFIIRSAYLAALYDTLNKKNVLSYITNIEDIHRLGYKFGGPAAYRNLYVDDPAIYDNWIILNNTRSDEIRDEILAGTTDFTLAYSKHQIMYAANVQKKHSDGLNIFPRDIVSSHFVMYSRKYSGLASYFNRIIEIGVEGGFYSYIEAKYINNLEKEFFKINLKPITLRDCQGPLVIWFTGIFISIIYFVVEIICERC